MGPSMHLVNTRLDICFAVNNLSQFMVEPRKALGSSKTCAQILEGHSGVWYEIYWRW
jgi:hypothetical protein